MDEKLYTELFRLRAKLKQEPTQDGRTPTVCTDRALLDLANACPKTKEELTLVAGLGKTFADKYGDAFLAVISDYRKEKCDNILLAEDVRTVLKNLENRLVNINKKNRLLYQGKLYNKYAVDLYDKKRAKNAELVKRLLFGGKEVVICDLRTGEIRENEKNYKKILMLIREVEKDLRESGQYELYVGYPYAVGKMRGDDFNIRAPLALFPVEIRREADFITLKADKSRDILFNNNLILTHNKLNSLKKDLPQNSVQSETAEGFESELYEFFSTNGIELLDFENIVTDEGSDLESFLEYKTTDFPKFKSGEYRVVRNAVLGKFSFYSGALQKDFKDIIDGDEINGLLSELLENAGESDFFAEAADGAEKRAEEIREHDLFYINELNASQERAAVSALTDKNLVIQGPPGTGKSQTITSIIADFARRGKTVAMVSQKKAAIDVIYSRLGTLSKYALMIDDVKDKEGFYVQLERLFSAPAVIPIAPSAAVSNAARDAVSSTVRSSSIPNANGGEEIDGAVDARIDRLERIAKTLYETDSHGNVLYRIYLENMRNIYLDGDFSDAAVMNEKLSDAVRGFCYAEIKKLKGFFEYGNNAVETERYFRIQGKYPWLDTLKRGLNVFETAEMEKAAKGFEDAQTDYQKQNVFKRILKRGEQKKALKGFLNKYFENQDCQKLFFETPRLLGKGLAKRGEYVGARSVLLTLSEREREYSENLYAVSKALDFEIKLANRRIYDYLVFCIIDRFESENREILKDVTNYETVVREICEAMNRKKDLSRDTLRAYLDGCYREHILRSKRSG
ncbi:MAG: HRDC domain-containing protein, partial [Clostridiales bacterium]|nr:HRDC domain-containing protein [Clostridiales bacterium]